MPYFETSAKEDTKVTDAFMEMIYRTMKIDKPSTALNAPL